jgi:hypothetical protein
LVHGYTEQQDGKVSKFIGQCSGQECPPHHV